MTVNNMNQTTSKRREIKFSYIAQHEETGRFMEQTFTMEQIEGGDFVNQWKKKFPRWTIIARREFTGLKDKNGKEIYEGDILHIVEAGDYGGEYNAPISYLDNWAVFGIVLLDCKEIAKSKTNERVETIWTRGFLTRKLGSCVQLHEAMKFELCEVIGNIYENHELLTPNNNNK